MTSPPLARETDWGRFYVNFLTGEQVPSITNCIEMLAKPAVENWKLRLAADCANARWDEMTDWHPDQRKEAMTSAHAEYTGERARIGTLVHNICERLIKGIPTEIPKEAASYVSQFGKFTMDKRPRFLLSEFTVWSRTLAYAGTADFLAEIDGKMVLCDIKTGKNAHPENGLQLAALRYAEFLITPQCEEKPMPHVDSLAVLHLRPRGWKLIPIREEWDCFHAFDAARYLFRWQHEIADHVLGMAALWPWFPSILNASTAGECRSGSTRWRTARMRASSARCTSRRTACPAASSRWRILISRTGGMMLWLRRDIAVNHPYALDRMLVGTGLARSLTEARRLIGDGAIYANNEKLVPPEKGFLPVPVVTEMGIVEYIALGIR